MISSISGEIISIGEDDLTININGIGFRVNVPKSVCAEHHPGQKISLFTHLVVREDVLALYGFDTLEERDLFLLIIGVAGVGPKIGLGTLSFLSTDAIRRAVLSEEAEIFNRVPGIGKKTAQKIIIHLQGRIKATGPMESLSAMNEADSEVLEALVGLGYSVVEAQTAIQSIPSDTPQDVEERLRLALQYFS